jgi:hypothetical protein
MDLQDSEQTETGRARAEWQAAIGELERQISEWAGAEGWEVTAAPRELREESIGTYVVPDLRIATPDGQRLVLEVKARGPLQARGQVELLAWPTLFRVMLLQQQDEGQWIIRTDSGVPIRKRWNRRTFIELAKDLLGAEA